MPSKASKAMIIGIDAPIVPRLYKMAKKGQLPALGKLLAEGTFAPNCLPPFPTITPPNWTTIVTGAWPGTHGITDFDGHVPGEALDKTHQNFDAREVLAEPLWKAAGRAGKKSILVNYPTSWHSGVDGWQVGGYGLNANDVRLGFPKSSVNRDNLCKEILLSVEPYPFSSEVTFRKASGWEGIELSPKALEAEVRPLMRGTLYQMEPITWHILIDQSEGKGYDTAILARAKNKAGVYTRLKAGEWSGHIYDTFQTKDAGPQQAVFRVKLLELAADGSAFRLFVPNLCNLHGWGVPASLEAEIKSENGLPLGRAPWDTWLMEWIDSQTMVETVDYHNVWLADAATYLLKNKPWDLYFMHIHTPDSMYHIFSSDLDPLTAKDEALRQEIEGTELALYQSVDRCIGRIVAEAPADTLIVITSDHGAKAKTASFNVADVLEQAGLLVYKPSKEGEPRQIDWSRTKAVSQRRVHIYVNVKGRDPEGIVEPGEEYEKVREAVIKALYEYTDPKTGYKPISLALKQEDARIIGQYGPRSGDIIYAVDPHFDKEHGVHLPTARIGIGDLRTLFILKGPGVKQGAEIQRTVWLTDIVPTICYLTELPVPAQAEGAVVWQAMEDPDAQVKELQSLRRNVERLKRMVERPPMC
ncbi:MAG: alkaline phosphatase family protein [Dehalococcoidales bacterium]|nr:alkaline phosphatase family protein [Dehalococcoidales bacterium]